MAGKTGRPKRKFTPEQIDTAKHLLGRRIYPSKVATELRTEFPDLNVPQSYRLIEAAQREVVEAFAGDGSDPLAATYLFLVSVMSGEDETTRDRVAAANAAIKLLGMNKLIKSLQDAGDVDEFLAGVMARRAARAGEKSAPDPKPTS